LSGFEFAITAKTAHVLQGLSRGRISPSNMNTVFAELRGASM
jgi:hypothetical protein